ncbi:hypothetical protein SOASR015_31300 [Pectobacterium carotovorum subsp. carotovorum]|nr:hypothetical protein SOASR015_31300 [Pectobacterium carotovorum subsp. carotovorum]GLX57744.1 hypothetical protein Pcaca02_30530 [Pectobacterium carotovorum subsp. carotovorum]
MGNGFIVYQAEITTSKRIGNMSKVSTAMVYYVLLLGGMVGRKIYRSQSLREQNPEVYSELRRDGLDLLFEDQVEPLVEAIKMSRTYGAGMFSNLIDKVEYRMK